MMSGPRWLMVVLIGLVTLRLLGSIGAEEVSDARLLNAYQDATNWLLYGRDYSNQRYSPLDQIKVSNVKALITKWSYRTGKVGSFQTSPLVVDGVMYATTPFNHVVALDARNGTQIWRYEHKLRTEKFCCGPANRGAAIGYGKVYTTTIDARLLALEQKTGRVVWDVTIADPEAGKRETVGEVLGVRELQGGIVTGSTGYSSNMAPLVYKWKVIVGTKAVGYGDHLNIKEGEKEAFKKFPNTWKAGGGSLWSASAVDPELGLIYVGTGNPSPQMDDSTRPGDNLYTVSLVALDAETGRLKWHYQQVPHDRWGYDVASPAVLFDVTKDGRTLKAVGQAGKTGWFYVHDRRTGKLLLRSEPFVPQENLFARPTAGGVRIAPSATGGSSWSPVAFSPQTEAVYISGLHMPARYISRTLGPGPSSPWKSYTFFVPLRDEHWGTFTAIHASTGKILWQKKTDQPLVGGALATAGGLVFVGEGNGYFDAFDAKTGEVLWRFRCDAGVNAPPISYEVDGVQYLAVAAGGNSIFGYPLGDEIKVFTLP